MQTTDVAASTAKSVKVVSKQPLTEEEVAR
jgi:hypothetical protein